MSIRPVVGFELDTERFVRREGSGYRKSETPRKDLLDSTDVTPPGGVVQLALRHISKNADCGGFRQDSEHTAFDYDVLCGPCVIGSVSVKTTLSPSLQELRQALNGIAHSILDASERLDDTVTSKL